MPVQKRSTTKEQRAEAARRRQEEAAEGEEPDELPVVEVKDKELVEWAETVLDNKREIKYLDGEQKKAQGNIIERMKDGGLKSIRMDTLSGDSEIQITLVEGESHTLNTDTLRKLIGEEKFQALTTLQFDPDLVDDALAKGTISQGDIEAATEHTPRAPFVKVTLK